MKYEEIYKIIRDECASVSRKVNSIQTPNMSHKTWIELEDIKESCIKLRNYLFQFAKKIVEDGGGTV